MHITFAPTIKFLLQQLYSTTLAGIIFWLQNLPNNGTMPSSVVSAIRYDATTLTLRVIYVSGSIYDYKQVPEKIYKDMRVASSKGEFLNKHIKPNYEFEKIR